VQDKERYKGLVRNIQVSSAVTSFICIQTKHVMSL